MAFKDWFEGKYLEWRNKQPRNKQSVRTFALWLGLKQPTVNNYINGKRTPKGQELDLVAEKLGQDAYQEAGELPPDARLMKIIQSWPLLSEEQRERFANEAEADAAQHTKNTPERVAKDE